MPNRLSIASNLTLPVEAVTQTFALLAKRGVGKTYTALVMVEEMLKAGLHVVVADPVGVAWGLRASADGKGPGLPIVVLGGDHGDTAITTESRKLGLHPRNQPPWIARPSTVQPVRGPHPFYRHSRFQDLLKNNSPLKFLGASAPSPRCTVRLVANGWTRRRRTLSPPKAGGASPMIHTASAYRLCHCGQVHRPRAEAGLARLLRPYDAMFATNTLKNLMLDALQESLSTGADFGSLHTAYSTTGTNEVTGGSPAYARVALVWAAAASGAIALAATLPTWNVPASTTVAWWGGWDAVTSGTFLFMMPIGAGTLRPASVETATDLTNNDIFAKAHGYVADTRVVFWGTLPTGLSVGTIYYVLATGLATDSFRVSTTSAGSAVDITGTAPLNFFSQSCVPETFAGQGTYALASGSVDLGAVA